MVTLRQSTETEPSADKIEWDARFMILASHVAGWSHLRGTKVGAVIVDPENEIQAIGVSGFPRGVNRTIDERYSVEKGENKYWICHAEQNAIHSAARLGHSMNGCRLYTSMFPCADCARAIIQSGIMKVVSPPPDGSDPKWIAHFERSMAMLSEAGVEVQHWLENRRLLESEL